MFAQLVKGTKQNIIQREVFDKSLKDEVNDYSVELGETTSKFNKTSMIPLFTKEILKLSMLSFMGKLCSTLPLY